MKITIIAVVLFASVLLCGCTVPIFSPNTLGADARLPVKNTQYGLVAFTTVCESTKPLSLLMSYQWMKHVNAAKAFFIGRPGTWHVQIDCANNADDNFGDYVMNLPAGKYQIFDIAPAGDYSEKFKVIHFKVQPGKFNYIGEIYIKATPAVKRKSAIANILRGYKSLGSGAVTIVDAQQDDLPYFHKTYPDIPRKSYVVNLMHKVKS